MKFKTLFIAKGAKYLLHLLIRTCRIEIEGLDHFQTIAKQEKCILMLWHNRLAVVPAILSRFTQGLEYAALVSGSRDGEILSTLIESYKNGRSIRAPHLSRHQALREVIRQIEEKKQVIVITPDGPRGPLYEVKPGIALAALETGAYVFPLSWDAENYWEFNTWDRFRLPKPFTKIRLSFAEPIRFDQSPQPSLQEAIAILKNSLPKN